MNVENTDSTIAENYEKGFLQGYNKGTEEATEHFLDAYCKTCCNLNRKTCLELDGMCKQYAKMLKAMEE